MITVSHRLTGGLTAVALTIALAACGDNDPAAPEVTDPCAPQHITLGSSASGSIDADGCRRGGHPVDRWTFDLTADTDVRIDLTSSTIDPVSRAAGDVGWPHRAQ